MNKKHLLYIVLFVLGTSFMNACKNAGSETKTENMEVKSEVYQCPMKCDNKTFDKPGNCSVCGMELEKLESI